MRYFRLLLATAGKAVRPLAASVVHQDVKPAKCFFRFGEKAIIVCLPGNVPVNRDGLASACSDFGDDLVRAVCGKMPFITVMEKFAIHGGMISEQLWDADDLRATA